MTARAVTPDSTLPLGSKKQRGEAPPLGAIVRVVSAPAEPETLRLEAGAVCRIGSAPGSTIAIRDATVSRSHVELTLVDEGVSVVDLGSRNGTFYLGQRLERMTLALGSRIEVGGVLVALDLDVDALHEPAAYDGDSYAGMVGVSPAMNRLFSLLKRLEGSVASVLIEGESGVGKERVARAIHEQSSVAGGPFVVLNCGALPRELIASELFGHRKGAFTGAVETRRGAFESAHGGTLFLDEIGELPLDMQPMLLRVLETGEIRAMGEDVSRHVKVRILAATNKDLEVEVREERFREDLFYRLAVARLQVPPLRSRIEDIAMLASLFAREAEIDELRPDMLEIFKSHAWPGNVRELRNAVQAFAALGTLPRPARSKAATLGLALRELVDPRVPYAEQKDALVERFTATYLESLMEAAGENQTAAARMAGLDRGYLGKLLAKHRPPRG